MRVFASCLLTLLLGHPVGAQPQADPVPRLSFAMGEIYPAQPYVHFLPGDLTYGSPLYVTPPKDQCLLIRGERAWIDLGVRWTGAIPLRLFPEGDALVSMRVRQGPNRVISWPISVGWRPASGQRQEGDGSFEVSFRQGLRFRINLQRATATLPPGIYDLCFRPNLRASDGVTWERAIDACYGFALIEDDSPATRLELLRRQAIESLAEYRCDEAMASVDQMLQVDRHSAAAYRLGVSSQSCSSVRVMRAPITWRQFACCDPAAIATLC